MELAMGGKTRVLKGTCHTPPYFLTLEIKDFKDKMKATCMNNCNKLIKKNNKYNNKMIK